MANVKDYAVTQAGEKIATFVLNTFDTVGAPVAVEMQCMVLCDALGNIFDPRKLASVDQADKIIELLQKLVGDGNE